MGPSLTSPAGARLSHDKSGSLLYVTDWYPTGCNPSGQHCRQYGEVYVYNARLNNPPPLATITDKVFTPTVACLDSKGVLYVANSHAAPFPTHGWISEYLPGQTKPSLIIRKGINVPYGCAIDANDNLFVSNAAGINITEYKPGQTEPTVVLNKNNGLFAPAPIALDSSGNLYVINNDYEGHANVQVFAPGAKQPTATITAGAWWPRNCRRRQRHAVSIELPDIKPARRGHRISPGPNRAFSDHYRRLMGAVGSNRGQQRTLVCQRQSELPTIHH